MTRLLVFILLFASTGSSLFAQKFPNGKAEKTLFEQAEEHFNLFLYDMAVMEYHELEKNHPDEPILIFRIGQCYLYLPDGAEKSLEYLSKMDYEQFYADNVEFYLAKALHLNSKFEESKQMFEQFKKNKYGEKELKAKVDRYVFYCNNGIELSKNPLNIKIENIGAPINTDGAEYAPNITADESEIYFTYRGTLSMGGVQTSLSNPYSPVDEYYEDIFFSTKDANGNWTRPMPLPPPINTEDNNACVALTNDGNLIYVFNSIPGGDIGSISASKRIGTEWEVPSLLPGDVNSSAWEGDITISADRKFMIVASEREGGLGGSDLWTVELQADGTWGNLQNMGPGVNTEYDEHSPFIHPSGAFFVFSSKGHNTIGGYDLFRCDLNDNNEWSKPMNMGIPLNTPHDDVFYTISADGKHGYYASANVGGKGSYDIYMISPGIVGVKIVLAQLKGTITLNDEPIEAEVDISYTKTQKKQGNYPNNSATGKYLVELAAGKEYSITYTTVEGQTETRSLNTTNITDFLDTTINIAFYTEEFLAAKEKEKELALEKEKELAGKENTPKAGEYQYEVHYGYNKMGIKSSDKDYKNLVNGIAEIVKINGKAIIDMEASASKVPTTTYSTNENLSRLRSEKAKETLLASLKAKGVDTSKVIFKEVRSVVKGPEFNDDHITNRKEYEKFQYVKISAK